MVFGVAPIARVGQAIRHGPWRELTDALVGYGVIWRPDIGQELST